MSSQLEKYDYEPFADTDEYKQVNSDIIKTWIQIIIEKGTESIDKLLDIATGAGTMVQLFFNLLPSNLKQSAVLCLDQSAEALKLTQKRLGSEIKKLNLINSQIQDMDLPDKSVDVALWGNGIHYLCEDEQMECLKRIKKVLKPGGLFFFNTAFYEEARPTKTLPFYRTQVKNAVQFLRQKGIEREKTEKKAEAGKFHPRSYYEELVSKAGFSLVEAQEFAAELTKDAWEHISAFQQYAAGALSGYPMDDASTAMKNAVEPAILKHGEINNKGNFFVIRNWLAISAQA
ncbi:MAG: class I SAM-dependent methyltransferase [Thermodesulfobacteriota bacterium]